MLAPTPGHHALGHQTVDPAAPGGGRITVTTPVKTEAESKTALPFFLWRVNCIDLATSRHSSVGRRYRDFDQLRRLLIAGWPGVLLPMLPPKDTIQGQVGSRRRCIVMWAPPCIFP